MSPSLLAVQLRDALDKMLNLGDLGGLGEACYEEMLEINIVSNAFWATSDGKIG
jgi:hypothetical protein